MNSPESIVEESVAQFRTHTGFAVAVENGGRMIMTDGKSKAYEFSYQVTKSVTAPKATITESKSGEPHLVISSYISDPAKRYLKEHDINYLDAAGNAYLRVADQLLVYVETGKSVRPSPTIKGRAFTRAGLRVVYQFLTNATVNRPYREIGKLAGVSIDTVSKTIKDLLSSSYLIEVEPKVYELNQQEELVESWVTAFNRVLRPRLKSAHFSFRPGSGPYDLARNCPAGSLGGELAADVLGTNLIGEQAILYTDQPLHALARALDLVPAGKGGPVEIVRQFWNGTESDRRTVSPLLVYADLRYGATPRDLAAAGELYESYVRPCYE